MDWLTVNRFKTYRVMRWHRSNYLWTTNPYLDKYRIKVTDDGPGPQDILAIPCPHVPGKEEYAHRDDRLRINDGHRGDVEYADTPMICDSSLDYAYLDPPMRRTVEMPQVRAYLTGVTFRDQLPQRRQCWGGEYYGAVYKHREIYNAGPEPRNERPALSDVYEKLKLFRPPTPPFDDDVFAHIASKILPLKDRPIDTFFSGRTTYFPRGERSHPTAIRQLLERIWPTLPGNNVFRCYDNFAGTRKAGKKIKTFKYPYEYVDTLLQTKVVISPWGWSPWCVRDLEALICGCIVIKPECSNMLVYPDIYNPVNQCMIWGDLLYVGLVEQLNYIRSNLDEMQQRADKSRKFVTASLYPNDVLYQYWTSRLRPLLDSIMNSKSYAR